MPENELIDAAMHTGIMHISGITIRTATYSENAQNDQQEKLVREMLTFNIREARERLYHMG